MSATPALLAIAYLIPVSVWWFVQMSILSQASSPALAPFSVQVLQTLIVVQVLCLCLFAPHWIKPRFRITHGAATIASSLLPAWPFLAMLWLATGIPAAALAVIQAVAAGIGLVVAGIATLLQQSRVTAEMLRLLQSCLGLAAATLAWLLRSEWLQWVTR